MAESESSELLDVSPYEGGNMLNSEVFRTRDIRWISANLDMREWKAFWHQPYLERGPSKFWFHVPSVEEREEVSDIIEELGLSEKIHEILFLPKAWKKTWLDTDVNVWEEWYYLTRIPNANWTANVFHPSAEWNEILQMAIKNAISVRWFRNSPIVPTTEWKKLSPGGRPRLPDEYQEVEYIESDWNAYINTWILSKNINEIEMDISDIYMWSSYADQYSYIVFGTTASSWRFSSTYYTNSWARFRYHKALTWGPHDDCNAPQTWSVNHLVYTRTQFTVNWNVWTQAWTDPSWANADEYPVCFWYCGNNSRSKYKMYSLKITTSTWEKTFVPCFRKADWAVWLFELSEGEFYANAWTWTFWMWRDIAYLPEEYEQVEYVLNTTWEEYINTWIKSGSSFVASFSIMPTLLDSEKWFIGAAWTSEDNLLTYYSWKFRWHNGWNYADTVSASVNSQYYIRIDTTWITINGSKYNVAAWSRYSWNDIWFFRSNWQSNLSYSPRVRYYGLRMWSQWSFVRDYVPCIRKSDGVIWFYDLVNGTFNTNQGGGAFVRWRIYSAYEVNSNTLSYFPLCDEKDVTWNRTLTLWNVTFPGNYANVNAASSYLLPNVAFWWSIITVSLFYYCQSLNSNSWNTLLCRNPWTYHHLLISWGNSSEGTAWRVWFWNDRWVGSSKVITPWSWYHFVMTKNWTNEKIYVNGELVLNSNDSRDNNTYQLSIFWWHTNSSWNQWSIWKLSEFIAENKERTQEEVVAYLNTMKDYYWIS